MPLEYEPELTYGLINNPWRGDGAGKKCAMGQETQSAAWRRIDRLGGTHRGW